MMQGYWSEFKSSDFRLLPDDLVVVQPLGATEQHGPHLPLCVDTALTEAVIDAMWPRLGRDANVLVLPTLTVTKSDEHLSFPGTLSLRATTLLAILGDLAASLAMTSVTRLFYLNGHGGNTALLDIAVREARTDHGLIAAHASWFSFADQAGFDPGKLAHDLHAGDLETSAMLASHPGLVDMSRAQDFRTAMQDWEAAGHLTGLTGQPARPGWRIEDLNPEGACGDAAAASVEKGRQLIDTAGRGLAAFLVDFARFDLPGRKG